MVKAFFLLFISFSLPAKKIVGVKYLNTMYGHLHQNPISYSSSLTTLGCGHPVKILEKKNVKEGWTYCKAGAHSGYIRNLFLSKRKPRCFSFKYPKFLGQFDLDLSQMYYWGKLNDQYIRVKTVVDSK